MYVYCNFVLLSSEKIVRTPLFWGLTTPATVPRDTASFTCMEARMWWQLLTINHALDRTTWSSHAHDTKIMHEYNNNNNNNKVTWWGLGVGGMVVKTIVS